MVWAPSGNLKGPTGATGPTGAAPLDGVAVQASTPVAPAVGYQKMYPKIDGKWYVQGSDGIEQEISIMPTLEEIFVDAAGLTTATTLYTAGDVLGSEMTFPVAKASGKGAIIQDALLTCKTPAVLGQSDLFLFKQASTPAVNNAPNSWADADIRNLLGIISFPTPTVSALNVMAMASLGLPLVVKGTSSVNIFGVLVTRVTHTVHFGSATDITVKLGVEQET